MERNIEVDILKGICIITLVLGHMSIEVGCLKYLAVYGFYFIGGYVFKEKPLNIFIKSKIFGLYMPFVRNCVIGGIILQLLNILLGGTYYSTLGISHTIKRALEFRISDNIFAPAWFVFPFFIILFLYWEIKKIVKNDKIVWGLTLVIYIFTYVFKEQLNGFIWNNCSWMTNVGIGIFLFSCGNVLKHKKTFEEKLFEGKYSVDFFIISCVAMFLLDRYFVFGLNLRMGEITSFVLNIYTIVFGMFFLFYVSKSIKKAGILKGFFSQIGQHSFNIMFFHILSCSIVTIVVHKLYGYDLPNNWTKSYMDGFLPLINSIVGVVVPVYGGMIGKYIKNKLSITEFANKK